MAEIKLDERNYRIHGERNKKLILKSLQECGAGRSILVDNDDVIIAGNGVYEQAEALKIPIRVIESDGSELIAIKRTDLQTSDEARKHLALADNLTNDTSVFDTSLIVEDFEDAELDAWEFEVDHINIDFGEEMHSNGFVSAVKDASDVFEVTFTFSKSLKEQYEAYIAANGKDTLTQIIISEICQDAEVK